MAAFTENPFGDRATIEEYTAKYLHAIDVFFSEASENGVWMYTLEPIDPNEDGSVLSITAITLPPPLNSYLPFWSNPADAIALGLYASDTSPQSVPLELFSLNILQNMPHDALTGINPVMRNGKTNAEGITDVLMVPPVLLPLSILEKIYRGAEPSTFYKDLAPWIQISKDLKHEA